MSTLEKEKSTKSVLTISKKKGLSPLVRVRPILIDKQKTLDFFDGKSVEVTKEQYEALKKRNWIEV